MKVTRKQLVLDYKFFKTESGRRILDDLRKKCKILTDGIDTKKGVDPHILCVLTGRADVVKYIHKMADTEPLEEHSRFAKGE